MLEDIPARGLFAWLWKLWLRKNFGRGAAKKSMFWGRREAADTSICPAGQAMVTWATVLLQGWGEAVPVPRQDVKE